MKRTLFLIKDTGGASAVMILVMMVAFAGLLALVLDLAHMQMVKSELQNAADDCALCGARAFVPLSGPNVVVSGQEMLAWATSAAISAISDNKTDNVSLNTLPLGDIQVGIWHYSDDPAQGDPLHPWQWPPPQSDWGTYIGPGIRVPTKKTDSYNAGPVRMTLAKIFGLESVSIGARATAALSGVGGFRPGTPCKPDIPICINPNLLGVGNQVTFHPDKLDTGGWSNFQGPGNNTNAADIKKYLNGQLSVGDLPPGTEISLNNGVMCSATKTLIDNADKWGLTKNLALGKNTYTPKDPLNPPIYTFGVCNVMKFNQYSTFGAVRAELIQVSSSPDDCALTIRIVGDVTWVCEGSYGGGPWYGVLSTEPKLVQ